MKRKSLFLLLLLAFFAPWAAMAQEPLTVYDQGGTNTSSYVPFWGNWADNSLKCEMVYPATKLSGMENGTINSLKFYTNGTDNIETTSGSNHWDGTFQIFMKEVSSTTISEFSGTTDATIVYEGQIPLVNGEMTIEFGTPYDYSGGNLLVGVYYTTGGHYKSEYFLGESASGASIYGRSGSSNYAPSQGNFLPKTTFTYTAGAPSSCEKPASFVADPVTSDQATLTWTGGSGTYNLDVKGGSYADWTPILENSTLTTKVLSVDANTAYQARVQSVCSGEVSGYKTVSFTTPCASESIPYSYGFEETASFDCWTPITGVSRSISDSYSTPYQGTYQLRFYGTASNLVVLPPVNAATNTLRVELYSRPEGTSSSCGKFAIGYITDPTDASTFHAVATFNYNDWSSPIAYTKKYADFNNPEDDVPANAYIALRQFDCSTNYGWYVDNITVKTVPTCLDPSGLYADNITTNSARLTWTAGNTGQDHWDIYYSTSSTEPTNATTPSITNTNQNPYPLSGLTPATTYYVWVRGNCGSEVSGWSLVHSFTTECEVVTIDATHPYTENFDSYSLNSAYTPSTHVLPTCWDYINGSNYSSNKIYPTMHYYASGTYYNSSPNYLRFYIDAYSGSNYDPKDQYAILPEMRNLSGLRLKLYAKIHSTASTYDATFKVGVMEGNTFVQVGNAITPTTTTYELYTIPFDNYTGTGNRIAILVEAPATPSASYTHAYRAVYIDDITVEEIPSCMDPDNLAEVENTATSHSLTFNWTAGGTETTWKLQYKKSSETEWTTYPNAVTTKPFKLTGLDAATTYNVRVAAWCTPSDSDGISPYSAPATATTECESVTAFPWTENFEGMTANTVPTCWDNSATTGTDYSSNPEYYWGVYSYNDNKMIRMYNFYAHGPLAIINSPTIVLPAEAKELTFDYTHTASSGAFSVKISEDGGTTFTELESYTKGSGTDSSNPGTFTEATISLADYANKSVILQFYSAVNYGSGAIFVDNIRIDNPPTCLKPSGLTCTGKTAHTATFSWTNGAASQNAWQIAYSTTADFNPDNVTPVDVTTNPATIEGLAQSTTYYAFVRANCGNDDYSAWCNAKVTFSTVAGNVTPTGLAVDASTITSSQATASWNAVAGNTLHESYDIYWATSDVTSVPDAPAAPNLISGITATSQVISSLDENTDYKVWVRDNCGTDGYSNWSSAVTFHTAEACQTPDGLAASNVTANSARITWNTYGLTGFNLRYGTDGENWTNITENVATPYTLSLLANTYYYVQVQAKCNTAVWSATLNFRTECDAITITDENFFTENFEAPVVTSVYNSPTGLEMPYCWDNFTDNTSTVYVIPHLITEGAPYNYASSGQVLYFYGSGNGYAVLPEFTNDLNTLQVDFKYGTEGPSQGTFTLGYITDEDVNFNTFDTIMYIQASSASDDHLIDAPTTYISNVPANATRLVFRWYYGSWYGGILDDVVVKLAPSCYPVGTLTYSDTLSTSVRLSWDLVDATQDAWQVQYATDADFNTGVKDKNAATNENFLLDGLTSETHYYVRVRGNCGSDGYGDWSNTVDFTTLEACPAPQNLAVSNITQYTADLTWNGDNDSYNIQYRTAAAPTTNQIFFEGFETYADEAALEAVWGVLDLGDGENTSELGLSAAAKKTDDYGFRFSSYSGSSSGDFDQYLISPQLDKAGLLEFAYKSSSGTADVFHVGYSSTTNDVSAFTWGDEIASASTWQTFSETMPEDAKYFAINYTAVYKYRLYIDDITIYEMADAGAWTPTTAISTTEKSCPLSGLISGTEYDVRVQGVCDGTPGDWSTQSFETVPYRTFTTNGNWNVAANWTPSGIPGDNDDVAIAAAATIPANTVAKVNNINIQTGGSITLANSGNNITSSGQLWHSNTGVTATVNLRVYGYSSAKDNYHLIASPFAGSLTLDGTSIVDDTENAFDLYMFDQSKNTKEWRNYEDDLKPFTALVNGTGYLYANNKSGWNNFALTGDLQPSNTDKEITLSYVEDKPFAGWNLVGNPFACNAYIKNATDNITAYYRMNTAGDGFTTATGAISPMEGIFVQTTATEQSFKFSRTTAAKSSQLNMNLRSDNKQLDNAILVFGEGQNLGKFSFREGSSKVYMPVEGNDYAALFTTEAMGTLPVNFKAENNGTYTLSFTSEEVSFAYLHLIDNMTGIETDLLANPSYSFEARTTDYESRFKLVFATGSSTGSDTFAFFSNGSFVINNDGEATLQVIDMNGRILKSESINGCANVNVKAAAGVYVLRLVNGNDVKVQKVVVR